MKTNVSLTSQPLHVINMQAREHNELRLERIQYTCRLRPLLRMQLSGMHGPVCVQLLWQPRRGNLTSVLRTLRVGLKNHSKHEFCIRAFSGFANVP